MKYEVLDLGLVYYKDILPNPKHIIGLVESLEERLKNEEHFGKKTAAKSWEAWKYGETTFNFKKLFQRPEALDPSDYYYNEMLEISSKLYNSLDLAFDHYSNTLYPFAGRVIKSSEVCLQILKYVSSGHLPAHQDQGISTRVLSSVMYLNDDYDGGEIEFMHSGVKIRPDAGSIIFFPSNFLYVHEVHPINNGTRYSLPFWYHNSLTPTYSDGSE